MNNFRGPYFFVPNTLHRKKFRAFAFRHQSRAYHP
jgi:hypothetical protein